MNVESNRLNTFLNWPASAPVDPIRIAKAGFFYTGEGTEVECFSCSGKISQWNYGDQVMWRHRTMQPNCAFVVNPQLSGNVPLVLPRECPVNSEHLLSVTDVVPDDREDHRDPDEELQDYGLTEEDQLYKNDALRGVSFSNWEDTSVSREALVSAGFYHAGEGRLRCAWCGGELAPFRNFGSLGHPLDVHRMYFPRCAHAASLETARRVNDLSPPISPPSNTSPIQSPVISTAYPQSSGAAHNEQLLAAGGTWRSLGVVGGGARHPAQAALAARLETFHSWPADRTQTPKDLADAGFFYTGSDDRVRCFYCDGGLGKWEASDTPWNEHAHWFPQCGYVLLVKGQQYVDTCRTRNTMQRCLSANTGLTARRRNQGVNFPVTESQVEECMESEAALAALGAGLDVARVRRALLRRLRATGLPFNSSEALIDAVLDEQLNEEAWSVTPHSQRLARDILADTLRDFSARPGITPSSQEDSSDLSEDQTSQSDSPVRSETLVPTETRETRPTESTVSSTSNLDTSNQENVIENCDNQQNGNKTTQEKPKLTLEEENRQLKEARLCKVCMDSEVSVVFLPCGHLVSCGGCGAALPACPLCRAPVRAYARAYLA